MASVVSINCNIPTAEEHLDYFSGESLRDYDIAIFKPRFPFMDRIYFDGGGSCISIEASKRLIIAMSHWSQELKNALQRGKTVFVILDEMQNDQAATSSEYKARQRTYSTGGVSSYSALPIRISGHNTQGRKVFCKDKTFSGLYDVLKDDISYRVVLEIPQKAITFRTKDNDALGGVLKGKDLPGSLVLIPYFDFDGEADYDEDQEEWAPAAIARSRALIGQMVAIDKHLRGTVDRIPPPPWTSEINIPEIVQGIAMQIAQADDDILKLQRKRAALVEDKGKLDDYQNLLFGTGKALEMAIENALRLIGYNVDTFRSGDLEIDHVIVGPSGLRMIGESEGKDTSAIDVSKFRQLESNIGEDYERPEVTEPARGVLFGNGYRLQPPAGRPEQFTEKCIKNAKRLSSVLVRTADLYRLIAHLLDNPADEPFKKACRDALESAVGEIVRFPTVPD